MDRKSRPFRWLPEFVVLSRHRSRTQGTLLGAAILVGVIAGLGAVVFSVTCQTIVRFSLDAVAGYRASGPDGEAKVGWLDESNRRLHPWLLIVTAAGGGLLSGALVFRFAPEAEGHGTDSVIAAYHRNNGNIRSRVPIVKLLASALTIGTGGSGGREGPIAQIGAGFGSLLSRALKLRSAQRRVLVAAGMGAGVAAIFRAPLAGALFASEVLYSSPEFEPEVIMPAGLASAVAYCTFGVFFGWQPLFTTPNVGFDNAWQLLPYTALALLMVIMAMIYTRSFYWFSRRWASARLPRFLKPSIGAALSALLGIAMFHASGRDVRSLSVLSFGYGILQDALRNPTGITAGLLLCVAIGKIVTTGLTIGSGGSGGVFGPSMVIGGCAGGAFGISCHNLWPNLVPHPESFMIVGMAGFFAAAAKTPFSTLIIVCELTGDYRLILPALWVCTLSYLLSDEQSLYHSQVEGRGNSPAHKGFFARQVLAGRTVGDLIHRNGATPRLLLNDSLELVMEKLEQSNCALLPVVGPDGRFLGTVDLSAVLWATNRRESMPWLVAIDLARTKVQPLNVADSLDRAAELFVDSDQAELPVVKSPTDKQFLGMISRVDLSHECLRHIHVGESQPELSIH